MKEQCDTVIFYISKWSLHSWLLKKRCLSHFGHGCSTSVESQHHDLERWWEVLTVVYMSKHYHGVVVSSIAAGIPKQYWPYDI